MTSMTQEFKKNCLKFFDFFVLLVTFEFSSLYPKFDSTHWLKNDVQWIIDKFFFREKIMV